MLRFVACFGCLVFGHWLVEAPVRSEGPFVLRDVTSPSGVRFRHTDGSSGQRYIIEGMSAGLALLDYDADGDLDLYLVNGAPLPGAKRTEAPGNALYRNDGNWQFSDVTAQAGVAGAAFGLGVCSADYDNDGFVDLYVSNYGPNVLYKNNGDGSFRDATAEAGVGIGNHVGAGVSFFDMDADGDLDLYAANYIDFDIAAHKPHFHKGVPAYPGPLLYTPATHVLFCNRGDGSFVDVSRESGVSERKGYGMGVVAADYDDDGDQDLFVANDLQANFLLRNDGTGKFTDVALLAGTAFDLTGASLANMGVDAADFDNDGLVDFHVTTFSGEFATLYRNLGGGMFEDATRLTGAGEGSFPHVKWGNAFGDFDNDGHRDLFVACGHLDENARARGGTNATAFAVPNVVLRNLGNSRFQDVSAASGEGLRPVLSSRGAAVGDLDVDGDLDVVVLNSRELPTLIRNDTPSPNHWLCLRLIGSASNRSGVGAKLKVHTASAVYVEEVHSGRSYQSDFGQWLHFGLGSATRATKIEIRWPSGAVSTIADVAADRIVVLREAQAGALEVAPFRGESADAIRSPRGGSRSQSPN